MSVEQPVGQALSRVLAPGAEVDDQIDAFIRRRHEDRVRKEERDRAEEELWKASVRKYNVARDAERRAAWSEYHAEQAARHRRNLEVLAAYHEEQAASLGPGPEDAA